MDHRDDIEAASDLVDASNEEAHSGSAGGGVIGDEKRDGREIVVVPIDSSKADGDLGRMSGVHVPLAQYVSTVASSIKVNVEIVRSITRTPSPTPSEIVALERKGVIDFKSLLSWRFWVRKRWIKFYVILAFIMTIVVLLAVFHTQIALALQPFAEKIRRLRAGWLIPIALLFILSFPPLFGHEIVAAIAGLVWGLWIGFGIVAAGTYFGEVGNFYAFRYLCRARGEKWEREKISYACLAKIVREGGVRVATIVRWSVIPGHFSTAVFATCGMNFLVFSFSAIASLPKHFIPVYVGFVLGINTAKETRREHIITYSVLGGTTVVTICAFLYIAKKMEAVKLEVIRARRRRRQIKIDRAIIPASVEEPIVVELHTVRSQTSGMSAVV